MVYSKTEKNNIVRQSRVNPHRGYWVEYPMTEDRERAHEEQNGMIFDLYERSH